MKKNLFVLPQEMHETNINELANGNNINNQVQLDDSNFVKSQHLVGDPKTSSKFREVVFAKKFGQSPDDADRLANLIFTFSFFFC